MTYPTPSGEQVSEGWGVPGTSRKWHYFTEDGRSMCGRWGFFRSYMQLGDDDSPDNCAECKRRKAKLPSPDAHQEEKK